MLCIGTANTAAKGSTDVHAVVVGGSGQIGGWLLRSLAERGHSAVGTYATVPFPGLAPLDASDLAGAAEWLRRQQADVVFYPAGFTWVDQCERDPARARAGNVEQPLNLAHATADSGARFVYFSTDYVFDGRSGPYRETDTSCPLSAYGASKRDAEIALASCLGDHLLTVRTCWVFGPERQGKNFAYQLSRTLRDGRMLTCPSDQVSSPSYGPDVALATVRLVEIGESGLVHVAGPEILNRVRFAFALAEAFGLDTSLIVSKSTEELAQTAPRPLEGGLLTPRLDDSLPGLMQPLTQALEDFKARVAATEGWAPLP
jgi:dTDP-4-dehydrorhamnose reductase